MDGRQILDQTIQQVDSLHEVEYGDFKRKLGLYILRLQQGLQLKDPKTEAVIDELRNKIIYSPEANIESARVEALESLKRLRNLV